MDKCLPFIILRENKEYEWNEEHETTFQFIMEYLGKALLWVSLTPSDVLYLYLYAIEKVVNTILVAERETITSLLY